MWSIARIGHVPSRPPRSHEGFYKGLRSLADRDIFVVAESEIFKNKFQRATDDDENKTNCFDARYELAEGERANCILDWERRHVAMCAAQNNLNIVYVNNGGYVSYNVQKVGKPEWYK